MRLFSSVFLLGALRVFFYFSSVSKPSLCSGETSTRSGIRKGSDGVYPSRDSYTYKWRERDQVPVYGGCCLATTGEGEWSQVVLSVCLRARGHECKDAQLVEEVHVAIWEELG